MSWEGVTVWGMLWARTFRRERGCNTKHEGVEHMINGDFALLPPKTIPGNFHSFHLEMRYMRLRLRSVHSHDSLSTILPPTTVGSIYVLLAI